MEFMDIDLESCKTLCLEKKCVNDCVIGYGIYIYYVSLIDVAGKNRFLKELLREATTICCKRRYVSFNLKIYVMRMFMINIGNSLFCL